MGRQVRLVVSGDEFSADLLAGDGDAPTIGLLLCRSKNDVVARYALRSMAGPIGIADWTTAIITSLPEELTSSLPSIADLEQELAAADPDGPVRALPGTSGRTGGSPAHRRP